MAKQLEHYEISRLIKKNFKFKIIPVLCNIEKTQNVGMMMRSAEISGVEEIILYRPPRNYPQQKLKRISRNAENFLSLKKFYSLDELINNYPKDIYNWVALEYTNVSAPVEIFKGFKNILLFIGNEKYGVSEEVLKNTDAHIHLNMHGNISSYNVAVAMSIALYQIRLNID